MRGLFDLMPGLSVAGYDTSSCCMSVAGSFLTLMLMYCWLLIVLVTSYLGPDYLLLMYKTLLIQ